MPKDTLSKRIRDLTRLLALDTLPETTRQEKERALDALREEKSAIKRQSHITQMTQKYKMVRFVEHQKAVRRLAQAEKALRMAQHEDADDTTALARAKEQVEMRKVDIVYNENFPILEKYISLYKDDVARNDKVRARRDEIWQLARAGRLLKGTVSLDSLTHSKADAQAAIDEKEVDEKDDFFE